MEESSSPNRDCSDDKKIPMSEELDRFGDLSEPILLHIFSFLDMKEVVATSLVMRSWRNLWKSVPVLNFNHPYWNIVESQKIPYLHASGWYSYYTVERKNSFMDFVEKVLFLRENSHISKLSLWSDWYCKEEHISEWITEFSRQHAQEVYINICPSFEVILEAGDALPETIQLPECLFHSTIKLCDLEVSTITNDFTFQLPNSMCSAAKLKSLYLVSARLPKGDLNGDLVLSCPVLESLVLDECDFSHLSIFTISSPQLQHLVLTTQLWGRNGSCKIKVIVPNLISFQCNGVFEDYYIEDLPLLSRSEVVSMTDREAQARSFIKLLNGVSAAITLKVSGFWNYKTLESSGLLHQLPHTFHNLKYLEVKWWKNSHIDLIANLLRRSPNLETLTLKFGQRVAPFRNWVEELSSDCIFHHLKCIEIKKFSGSENEFRLLEFLVKDAMVLEYFSVTATEEISEGEEFEELHQNLCLKPLPAPLLFSDSLSIIHPSLHLPSPTPSIPHRAPRAVTYSRSNFKLLQFEILSGSCFFAKLVGFLLPV